MNARQNFYAPVFERFQEYKRSKQNDHQDNRHQGFLGDHMVELGLFAVVLLLGVMYYFNPLTTTEQVADNERLIKIENNRDFNVFQPETTSADENIVSTSASGFTIASVDDGYTDATQAEKSFGKETVLRVDRLPERTTYIKFRLPSGRTFTKATLQLTPRDYANMGGFIATTPDGSWSEALLTAESAPVGGTTIGEIRAVSAGTPVEVDVTEAIKAAQSTVTIILTTNSSDGVNYYSRESDNGPELILE